MKGRTIPVRPERLRILPAPALPTGVDRQARVIRGYVVAQAGPFKSEGRGEFDEASLKQIVAMWPAAGLKSRFAHPTESSDGLGRYLGRVRAPRLATVTVERDGKAVEVPAVRADLHLDPTAFASPEGNLGEYVLSLAESDPAAISSSLVLAKQEEWRLQPDGTRLRDAEDELLPPLWRPTKLFASDVVDEGDAVDGILSATAEPRFTADYLSRGEALLNGMFAGATRAAVRSRCLSWLDRYLSRRFGDMAMLGKSLGSYLNDAVDAATSADRPREAVIADMANASGRDAGEVVQIVNGEDVPVDLPTLVAFCGVLGCGLGGCVTAAEEDGIVFTTAGEDEAEEPVPDPGMGPGEPMSVRRRKLELRARLLQ